MIRLIVAGSRNFKDYNLLKSKLDHLLKDTSEVEIVSGTANGADKLGERYAKENNYPVKQFPADWDAYGKAAGYKRNKQMAEYATHCVCFWDGVSKGTKSMIELAKQHKLILRVINY